MSKRRPHRPWRCPWKGLTWLVFCRGCGLVYLRNERTQKAIDAGCDGGEE